MIHRRHKRYAYAHYATPIEVLGPQPTPQWTPAPVYHDEGRLHCGECQQPAVDCAAVILLCHRRMGCRGIIHTGTGWHTCKPAAC